LAAALRTAGYGTGFFSNTVMLGLPGFTRGFDESSHLPRRWDLSGEGAKLSARALRFVSEQDGAPFFLYLHYLDPHGPYRPDPALYRRFGDGEPDFSLSLYEDVAPRLAELRAQGFGPGEERFEELVRRYDAEIAGTDAALAELFQGLAERKLLDRLLVVVTADHGEEFLEHGYVEHGWTLFAESLRVPLVFWAPAVLAPARVAEPVSLVDVAPTILALLGVNGGANGFDGAPLFALAGDRAVPDVERRPQLAELLIARRNVLRSVQLGDWKYVAAWRWLDPGRRHAGQKTQVARGRDLSASPLHEALFHLPSDPGEKHNRLADAPERAQELRKILRERLVAMPGAARSAAPEDFEVDPAEAERLRALGYR
jgi:arylsulfatase A-like enzyme